MSATDGKVALVNTTTALACGSNTNPCTPAKLATVVDLVGYGSSNLFEGTGATPTLTNTTAAFRDADGCTDTDDNAVDFSAGVPTPRNTASPQDPCGNVSCGAPLTTAEGFPAARTVTATDADGVVVDIEVTSVSPPPASGTITAGDTDPATEDGGTASAVITVDGDVSPGTYEVTVMASTDDEPPQTDACTLTVNVVELDPIGAVQGSVSNAANGLTRRSPFAPSSGTGSGSTIVAVRAVVYELTLARTSTGGSLHGFFLQDTDATADDDVNSSDGIFVFLGGTAMISGPGGTYTPEVGDEIVLAARVSEFFNLTQLVPPFTVVDVVGTGVDLDAAAAVEVGPPDVLADANRYWERREGMRAEIPADSVVVDSRGRRRRSTRSSPRRPCRKTSRRCVPHT
ncbi:MAG: hypothetical protein WD834_02315 [Actinomycetota bacterium]